MSLKDFENEFTEIISSRRSEEDKSIALTCLSQQIRRCAWQPHAKQPAYDLARKADEKAAALVGGSVSPAPRFDGFVSGGILHKPIK